MSVRIAVGVDAGGSSTVAAASRDGAFAGVGRGGPGNPSSLGAARAAAAIAATVRELLGSADPGALFVAAAGAGRAEARSALAAELGAAFPATPHLAVEDDTRVALRATLPEGPGIVLVAGTGSVAYAENGERRARVGGAGYLLGDEGSAYAIGLAAVRVLVRVYDGRASEEETAALAARALGATDRDTLLAAVYGTVPPDPARIAGLAPAIVAFADKGNRTSAKIVQTAAQELAELVKAAAKAVDLLEASPAIVFAGGLLRENSLLSFLLETRVVNDVPGCAILRGRDEPARAALRFAEGLIA
jgi:N-acetylglucosamine kinase-like BadF-type ATPase